MFCLEPPLEAAPEGEWACPAHRPGNARRNKTEPEQLTELHMEEKPERGMRHKPARVDAHKYQVTLRSCTAHPLPSVVQLYVNARLFHASQVAPTPMRSVEHRSSEVEAAEAVGLRAWHCDVCSDAQVHELLAFSHRLVDSETISEVPTATYLSFRTRTRPPHAILCFVTLRPNCYRCGLVSM